MRAIRHAPRHAERASVLGGHGLEQLLGLARLLRQALGLLRDRRPARPQRRQHVQAQVVAIVARLQVRRVVDPGEPACLRFGAQLGAREAEQWPAEPPGAERAEPNDAAQPPDSRAAHHAQQHGLELIVGVMRRQQPLVGNEQISEGAITRFARRGFEPFSRVAVDRYSHADEFDPERLGDPRAMLAPLGRARLQRVIDMRGAQSRGRLEAA